MLPLSRCAMAPGLIFEGLTAETADEEGVQRPDNGRDGGRDYEPAPVIADEAARQGDRRPATWDEPACQAKGDDGGLARQHREDRVQGRQDDRDQIRQG